MLEGYHFAPPCAVATPSSVKALSNSPSKSCPASRSRRIRLTTCVGEAGEADQSDPLCPLCRERIRGPLTDQPALELGEGGEYVRHRLPSRSRRIDGTIECYESPSLLLRRRHQRSEVEHRSTQAVELRDEARPPFPI